MPLMRRMVPPIARRGALVLLALAATGAQAQLLPPPPPRTAAPAPMVATPAPAPAPGAVPAPGSVNPVCTRLEGQLTSIDRGAADPAHADQIRRYEEAAGRQQGELDRVVAQSRRLGCEGGGFFSIFTQRPEQCGPLNQQIQQMRANLGRMLADLEQLRGGSVGRENERRTVLAALAQNDCGPQYRAAAAQPSGGGGFLGGLFGGGTITTPGEAPLVGQSSTFRTVCVRTCDGYYFPISYSTSPARFAEDERVCQRACPAAEVMLFAHRNPGEDINQAVSISGQNYTALPNAFRYRQAFNRDCSCRKPGQSWADALEGRDATIERGDIVVTEERAKQMSQPQQPRQQQQRGRSPAGAPAEAQQPAQPTTADNPTGPESGRKPVRTVGPTFLPPRQ
jgi:hypothetical protein